jgi:hypothetical protein
MTGADIAQWQRQPAGYDQHYYRPDTTYHATTFANAAGPHKPGHAVVAWLGPNAAVLGIETLVHVAAVDGNGHSVAASAFLGAIAAAGIGIAGVLAKPGGRSADFDWRGARVEAAALFGGFGLGCATLGGLLWIEGVEATLAAMAVGAGAISSVVWSIRHKITRLFERDAHEAGMQADQHLHGLQQTREHEFHATARTAIGYQAVVDSDGRADRITSRSDYELALRHPDLFSLPANATPQVRALYAQQAAAVEAPKRRQIAGGDDDVSALFEAVFSGESGR